jgi:soluble lytic murein transglycosylase-like protein
MALAGARRAGVAAVLAMLSRHTGPSVADHDRAQVDVETSNFRIADQGRDTFDALIEEAAAAHGLSAHLVRAVIEAESAFDPRAESPAGALGLMQLMPATAACLGVKDPLDPRQNVFGGVKYLSQLLGRYDGNVALTLAGYNAGPRRVARYRGIPPYGETRAYVTRIRGLIAESTGALFPLPKPAVVRSIRPAAIERAHTARVADPPRRDTHRHRRRSLHRLRRGAPPGAG